MFKHMGEESKKGTQFYKGLKGVTIHIRPRAHKKLTKYAKKSIFGSLQKLARFILETAAKKI